MRNLFHSFLLWFGWHYMIPTVMGYERGALEIDHFEDYEDGTVFRCVSLYNHRLYYNEE